MNKNKIIVVIAIIILLGLLAFKKYKTYTKNYLEKERITYIRLEIQAPFSHTALTIVPDGTITYEAEQRGQEKNEKTKTISSQQFGQIEQTILNANLFAMIDSPKKEDDKFDGSTYSIKVKRRLGTLAYGAVEHTVTCYEFSCVEDFLQLKDSIAKLWGEEVMEIGI